MEPRQETLRDPSAIEAFGQMLLQRLVGAAAEAIVVELGARGADDPGDRPAAARRNRARRAREAACAGQDRRSRRTSAGSKPSPSSAPAIERGRGANARIRMRSYMPVAAKVWPSGSSSLRSRPRVSLPNQATRISAAAVGTMIAKETSASGGTRREDREQLREHAPRLGAGRDGPGRPAADAERKTLRRIRQQHRDQRVRADDQQGDGEDRACRSPRIRAKARPRGPRG